MAHMYDKRVNILRRGVALVVLLLFAASLIAGLKYASSKAVDSTTCTLKMIHGDESKEYFMASLTEAVASANASANASGNGTRFEITMNAGNECYITDTLNINADVTIKSSDSNTAARVSRTTSITMFRVGAGYSLTIENINVDGGSASNCLVYVGGGTFTMNGSKSALTHCNNAEATPAANPATAVNGPGTVYVDSIPGKRGMFYMNGGSIIENHPVSGGGAYIEEGNMYMLWKKRKY